MLKRYYDVRDANEMRMKVELILPIEQLRGKLRKDGYYFRVYRGIQILQRCPTKWKDTPARKAAREKFVKQYRKTKTVSDTGLINGVNPLKTKIMARVKLPAGIESISGRVGGVCFRTMKASGRVYMYPINVQRGANGQNKGTKMPNAEEKARRERFAKRAGMVRYMRAAGSKLSAKELWKITAQVL